MTHKKVLRYVLILLLLLCVISVIVHLPQRLALSLEQKTASVYVEYPSLFPTLTRTVAIRFDPSYHYTGKRPGQIAAALGAQWSSAGVTRVLYRAYDPQYGAFYRTEYTYNEMGDFGRFDLLEKILFECHKRDIEVYAWFPVLNHAGAWNAHPEWREKGVSGEDYREEDTGLLYPLCTRKPPVRKWWLGFLNDFLVTYPDIDGVDFGEPVVSWKSGGACYCETCTKAQEEYGGQFSPEEIRSHPLTDAVLEGIEVVHRKEKKASVTAVITPKSTGENFTFEEIRALSGLDLERLFSADAERRLDCICPEFIWQQWKSAMKDAPALSERFTPEWTEKALREFVYRLDVPIEVLPHVEVTDFPGVSVTKADLKAAIRSALRVDVSGIDVYSSKQMDEKGWWGALRAIKSIVPLKRCLVLYDESAGMNDPVQIGELLRHFNVEITYLPMNRYSPGLAHTYENVFYVGTESDTPVPDSFLHDIHNLKTTLCWLGFNIESALSSEALSNSLGLEYLATEEARYNAVVYKDTTLTKEEPWTNVLRVFDEKKCEVFAWAVNTEEQVPYAIRSGRRFWYFADIPPSYAIEGGRFLVFADLLHDIMNEPHEEEHLAMVRIEDVHPLTDPGVLRVIADYLHRENVPFQVALVPFYVFPEQNLYVPMSEKPEFVSAIKYMVKQGGTVVMHGITHQRFDESTADYEFWDPVGDSPPEGETPHSIRRKIEEGLRECWSVDIYPLMWETPHYAGSQQFYNEVSDIFSLAMERRQALDESGTDQYLPYAIFPDRFGQIIVPENLGYVPYADQRPGVIVEPARNMKVVRDGVASFFFHPFINVDVLKGIVGTMKKDGFVFTNVAQLPVTVSSSSGIVTNLSGTIQKKTNVFQGEGKIASFPGIIRTRHDVTTESTGLFEKEVHLSKGELYIATFFNPYEQEDGSADSIKGKSEDTLASLKHVSNYFGELCRVPEPLVLTDAKGSSKTHNEGESFKAIFKLVGINVTEQDVSGFVSVPHVINLIIVPSGVAARLSESQMKEIVNAFNEGAISIITSGFSPLSDELQIERLEEQLTIEKIRDEQYADMNFVWDPAVVTYNFEAPGEATFIYTADETGLPVVISSPLNKGTYIFMSVPLDDQTTYGTKRYPYFLTHVFRALGFFPLFRKSTLEVYFNPGEREDIEIETLVKFWRRSGMRIIYTAAWQVYPEWTYDYAYLIHLAHTNGMLVYAWFEPPYVNEKFWEKHPEWREKNALGNDACGEWRKPMAMGDEQAVDGAMEEFDRMLMDYDWDGVVINRGGLEATPGPRSPETYTPFNIAARATFERTYGFDPLTLTDPESQYYWGTHPEVVDTFEQFRSSVAYSYMERLFSLIANVKSEKRDYLELIVTYNKDDYGTGLSLEDFLALKKKSGAILQLATMSDDVWKSIPDHFDAVQIVASPSDQLTSLYRMTPVQYPTGLGLYTLINRYVENNTRFSLFSESSLYEVDTHILPFLPTSSGHSLLHNEGLITGYSRSVETTFPEIASDNIMIDNDIAGSFYRNRLIVPMGEHKITIVDQINDSIMPLKSSARLVDCSGDILYTRVTHRGIAATYRSRGQRAILMVNEKPRNVFIDGARVKFESDKGLYGWALTMPEGRHETVIVTRSWFNLALTSLSLLMSNAIVAISLCALAGLLLILLITRVRATRKRRTPPGGVYPSDN